MTRSTPQPPDSGSHPGGMGSEASRDEAPAPKDPGPGAHGAAADEEEGPAPLPSRLLLASTPFVLVFLLLALDRCGG